MSMSVQLSQSHKKANQSQDDVSRFTLADDLNETQKSQVYMLQVKASSRSKITTVKDQRLRAKYKDIQRMKSLIVSRRDIV